MLRCAAGLLGLVLPCAGFAQAPLPLHVTYDTFAAGVHVADVQTGFNFGSRTYEMKIDFQTTDFISFFLRGHQSYEVTGVWHGSQAVPAHFIGTGVWRGVDRTTEIDYQQRKPVVRLLVPPNADERELVSEQLQANAIDTLSALAELIHRVAETGRCETTARTFDGRRAIELEARTIGEQILEPTSRSSFAGKALRCDFAGRMLAGFKFGDNRDRDSKPMHGSAWLARVIGDGPALPVRMTFETRWFGDATMYLTSIGPDPDFKVARRN
ncbi:MAG: hypothetical protein QOF90_2199 [Acetobacteraceae bacterium]|nr:hypothetical protein [Acetobacteraceae bacterium]